MLYHTHKCPEPNPKCRANAAFQLLLTTGTCILAECCERAHEYCTAGRRQRAVGPWVVCPILLLATLQSSPLLVFQSWLLFLAQLCGITVLGAVTGVPPSPLSVSVICGLSALSPGSLPLYIGPVSGCQGLVAYCNRKGHRGTLHRRLPVRQGGREGEGRLGDWSGCRQQQMGGGLLS